MSLGWGVRLKGFILELGCFYALVSVLIYGMPYHYMVVIMNMLRVFRFVCCVIVVAIVIIIVIVFFIHCHCYDYVYSLFECNVIFFGI